ncbi:glycosyltransferase [Chitinophaga sp. 22620]|uniref:glycosyltransferase n=1 Tax=Chitinophaga sp. 22620 TaxID=3453952 RepID=UPI003F864A91
MIRDRHIIIVGLQPWDIEIGSNCKNMALELSRHNKVLYVNRALDRITALRAGNDAKTQRRKSSLKGETTDLQEINGSLYTLDPRTVLESINKVPFPFLFDLLNRVNNKRLAREINNAAARLGFKDPLLFIDNDFFRAFYLPELLNGVNGTIYYIRDNLTSQPYFKRHGARLERRLMAKATMVAANSAYLARYGREYNVHSYDIGQGCEFGTVPAAPPALPEDLRQIPRPLIGYVGALISSRLDVGLIEHIALAKPAYSFVLVGPEDGTFSASRLHQLPNVHFLGSKPASMLGDYISQFDVCLNPQAVNEMTIGNYPRKIDEYLFFGKPVVATDTEAMRMFGDYVYLCNGPGSYEEAIDAALGEKNDANGLPEQRKQFALSHTWENCIAALGEKFTALNKLN